MLVVETIARIRREYFVKGKPIKEIVRDVKVSRNTVRKVIRSQATAFTYDRRVQPMPKLGPWTAELERMLEGFVKLTGFTPKSRYIVDGSSTQIQ